jgi:VWFA-related protein
MSRIRLPLALLSCALAAFTVTVALAQEARVQFVTPRHLATVLGDTKLEARVDLPGGVAVEQVIFTVDGIAVAVVEDAPWEAVWDAGDGDRGYRLEVIARLSDGSETSAVISTSPLRINQREEVGLVNLYPVVRDRGGRYVTELTKGDFRILERGTVQEIDRFTTERRPLRIGIVLDTSLSMGKDDKLVDAQQAALGFLDVLEQGDHGMLVTFSDSVRVSQEFTTDRKAIAGAIKETHAHGGTALYDAVWRTSRMLRDYDARRVVVLLSDGRDEATSGFEPGSLHTLDEALDQALRSDVMVFAIGLGRKLDQECTRPWARGYGYNANKKGCPEGESLQEVLGKLSDTTGGRLLISYSSRRLRNAFENVADDLRNQYSIAYSSSDPTKDGAWRQIAIETPGRDLRVIARDGYFAEGPRQRAGGAP